MDPNTMMNLRRLNIVPYGGYDPQEGNIESGPASDNEGGINNLLQFIRMQRLFDPERTQNEPIGPNTPINFGQSEDVSAPMPRMQGMDPRTGEEELDINSLYDPDTRAQDRMWDMINSMPTREEYKPSIWRKIGAGIVGGFQGAQAGSNMLNKPFNQATSDWKMKFDPLAKVADDERGNNTQQRQFATTVLADRAKNKSLDIAQQRADATSARADAYVKLQNFKMANPEWEIVKQEGGNYILINPVTKEVRDSGIRTGTLDEMTELNMRIKAAQGLEGQRQAGREKIQGLDQAFDADIFNKAEAGRNARDANNSSGSNNGTSELEVSRGRLNRARELQAKGNEWVKVSGDEIKISGAPSSWSRNREAKTAERQKALDYIYGSPNDSKNVKAEDKLPTNATPPKAPKGWKYVRNQANTGWTAVKE